MTGADAIANLNSWCIANTPSSCSNLNWWINKEMMIVGLSSNAREDELVKAFENGMHFFCPKPVETSMLASILKMTRDAPSLKIALKEIGQQAVRLESPNSGIISASSTINRDSRMQVRVKDKSNGNQRFAEVSSEDGVQETCTGQSQDVIVRKGKTGWKLFKKISKLLTGGRINPDSETSSIKSKNHEENKHNDEDDLGHLQEE